MSGLLTVCVALIGVAFAGCQVFIAIEKSRQEWFDRRYGVYLAFHRLLVMGFGIPPPEYGEDAGQRVINEAFLAKTQAVFLLKHVHYEMLEAIYVEAFAVINTRKNMPVMAKSLPGQMFSDHFDTYAIAQRDLDSHFAPLRDLFAPYLKPSMLVTGGVGWGIFKR